MCRSTNLIRTLVCLAAVVAVSADSARAQSGDPALRSYYSANGLLNRGLYDLAADEYRAFLDQYGNHEKASIARYGLGVALFRLGSFDDAAIEFQTLDSDRRHPFAAEIGTLLGQCRLESGDPDAAAAAFQTVLQRHPDHDLADDAAALLTESRYTAGQYDQVAAPCALLIERWPESPLRERTELFRGLAEMAQGDYRTAAEYLAAMMQEFPNGRYADQTSLLLAQSLHRSNALREALVQYRRVLDRAGESFMPDALYGLASALHQSGRNESAEQTIDQLLERYPDHELSVPARFLSGRIRFELGEYERAQRIFDTVAGIQCEQQDDAAYWTGKCALRRDRPKAAAEQLRTSIEQFPQSPLAAEMLFDLAVAQSRSADDRGALGTLSQFRERFPKHALKPDALHLAATTHHQREEYERSDELCTEFLRDHPDHDLARPIAFLAAENAFLRSEYDRAADRFRTFIAKHPDAPEHDRAVFRRGMALYRLGRHDEAAPLLAHSVDRAEIEPAFRTALLALGDVHFQNKSWSETERRLASYLAFGDDQPAADDALLKLGLARQRLGRPAEAIECYDRLLDAFEESPHRIHAHFERGQSLVALDRPNEARACFESVLELAPESSFAVHALNHLGAIASTQGRHAEAAAFFERVADRSSTGAGVAALLRQGEAHLAAGAYADAERVLTRLLERDSESSLAPQARARRAIAIARQDRPDEALNEIAQLDESGRSALDDELNATIEYERAWCLRALDRNDDAMNAYRALLGRSSDSDLHRHALLEIAELEAETGRHDDAADHLETLLSAADELDAELRKQAMYRYGLCAYRLEDHDAAAQRFEAFITAFPKSDLLASASLLCGESLFRRGAHQRASAYLRRVVDEHADSDECPTALLRLGECLAALQRWPRSQEAFAQHRRRFGESKLWFQAQFGLAWALENQGRTGEAIDAYRPIVDRHQGPTAARAQFQIGECLYAMNRHEEAVRELLKVDILYAYPEWSAAALYEAGRCFEQLRKPNEAKAHFERVRSEHPETEWSRLAAERLAALSSASRLPGRGE